MRAVVTLPTGLFCNAAVTIGVLILSGHGGSAGARFVGTNKASFFGGRAGGGILLSHRVGDVVSVFSGGRSVSRVTGAISCARVMRGSCSLSIKSCMRTGRRGGRVSVGRLGGEVRRVISHRGRLHTRVGGVVTRLRGRRL